MIKHIFTLIWNKKRSNFLLFLEIFLAFLVLFAVFTLVIYNLRVYQQPLGYNTQNTLITILYDSDPDADSTFIADSKIRLLKELRTFPEIEAATFTGFVAPLGNNTWSTSHDHNGFMIETHLFFGDENYDKVAGLNITEGRWFNEDDIRAKSTPVVINQVFKDKYLKDKPIIDSLFHISGADNKVVGILDHYRYNGEFTAEDAIVMVYQPGHINDSAGLQIRLKGDPTPAVEQKIGKAIKDIMKKNDFAIQHLEQKREQDSKGTWVPIITLLGICTFLIINIALGLFGVVWYNINKRKGEVGLRRAIGATTGDISFQFIGEVMAIVLIGILVGLFFAAQLPWLKLVDIENSNYYYAMAAAMGIIIVVVLVCTFYPSRQAAGIHPALALHED
ncbi:MAG: putative ABC transport system permease protein [Polaribacter sp.]|jgi:putative ABC transport system permease protein